MILQYNRLSKKSFFILVYNNFVKCLQAYIQKSMSALKKLDFDPYLMLGIVEGCEDSHIDKAYKKSALRWHPDKNPDNKAKAQEMFLKIYQAYEFLKDKVSRASYDQNAAAARRREQYEEVRRSTSSAQRKEFLSKLSERERAFENDRKKAKAGDQATDRLIEQLRREGAEMLKRMKAENEKRVAQQFVKSTPTSGISQQGLTSTSFPCNLDELERMALGDLI